MSAWLRAAPEGGGTGSGWWPPAAAGPGASAQCSSEHGGAARGGVDTAGPRVPGSTSWSEAARGSRLGRLQSRGRWQEVPQVRGLPPKLTLAPRQTPGPAGAAGVGRSVVPTGLRPRVWPGAGPWPAGPGFPPPWAGTATSAQWDHVPEPGCPRVAAAVPAPLARPDLPCVCGETVHEGREGLAGGVHGAPGALGTLVDAPRLPCGRGRRRRGRSVFQTCAPAPPGPGRSAESRRRSRPRPRDSEQSPRPVSDLGLRARACSLALGWEAGCGGQLCTSEGAPPLSFVSRRTGLSAEGGSGRGAVTPSRG